MYAVFSKRKIQFLILFVVLIVAFVLEGSVIGKENARDMNDTDIRIEYLKSIGISVADETLSVASFLIPEEFGAVYKSYNIIQKKAGFDLSEFKGRQVVQYSYDLADDGSVTVNLITYCGKLIGGDISGKVMGSEMLPLVEK